MKDTDLGNWNYQYDATSRLTKQRDARHALTVLSYDVMDRVVNRVSDLDGARAAVAYIYDDARSGFFNRGLLTTAVASNIKVQMGQADI